MMRDSIHPGETLREHLDALGTSAPEPTLFGPVVWEDFGAGIGRNVDARDQTRVAPAPPSRHPRKPRSQPANLQRRIAFAGIAVVE